ncbi:hypothetical protein CYMTET_5192 [Cymbomonas tetramitiformis]|uniref:Uncharacterized protein n=1 Tax=Cymbomonas tetramitiformis TaxID=36881 RepID=A0AAE0GZL4_9CHLO|nr:hypothetical protein CYMTET_5192 [Cymbomonas tetramitiformis]
MPIKRYSLKSLAKSRNKISKPGQFVILTLLLVACAPFIFHTSSSRPFRKDQDDPIPAIWGTETWQGASLADSPEFEDGVEDPTVLVSPPPESLVSKPSTLKKLSAAVRAALSDEDPFERGLAMTQLQEDESFCEMSNHKGKQELVPCATVVAQIIKEMKAATHQSGGHVLLKKFPGLLTRADMKRVEHMWKMEEMQQQQQQEEGGSASQKEPAPGNPLGLTDREQLVRKMQLNGLKHRGAQASQMDMQSALASVLLRKVTEPVHVVDIAQPPPHKHRHNDGWSLKPPAKVRAHP